MSQHARNNPDAPTVHDFFAGSGCIRTSSIVGTGKLTIEASPKAAHTPGPWEVCGTSVIWSPLAKAVVASVSALRETRVVQFTAPDMFGDDRHEMFANARLIASAPDLLRQRDELLAALNGVVSGGFTQTSTGYAHVSLAAFESARVAIARAKRESTASDLTTVCQSDTGKSALSKMDKQYSQPHDKEL